MLHNVKFESCLMFWTTNMHKVKWANVTGVLQQSDRVITDLREIVSRGRFM